ncbi:MAG TPA: 1-deoxy-D-xylulose-5-phosphate reductoisomerase, partial [Eubacteriaceae bacterium]|nr:1-deoxy-D-xylulose-5-phosphate reductoisomerase [Eubacteriaceae bacterium]
MENISILGSTGSIGRQTLDIVRDHRDRLRVIALTANRNIERLQQQIEEFSPEFVCVTDERKAKELKRQIGSKVEIYPGVDGLVEAAAHPKANRG